MINLANLITAPGGRSGNRTGEAAGGRMLDQPARLMCVVMVVFSAGFFLHHGAEFYADVDFASYDLGGSAIADFFVFYFERPLLVGRRHRRGPLWTFPS